MFDVRKRASKMKTKRFDCVAMMRRGARRIHEETGAMSRSEEQAYWQAKVQGQRVEDGRRPTVAARERWKSR